MDLVDEARPAHPRPRPSRRHGRERVRGAAGVSALLRGRRQQRARLCVRGARSRRRGRQSHRRFFARDGQRRVRAAAASSLVARVLRRFRQRVRAVQDGREDERWPGRPLAVAARADPPRSRAAARGGSRQLARAHYARARPMKWLKRSAIGLSILGVLVLGGGAAVLWAVGTENGTTWLVRRLLAGAPQLSIEDIRGTLLGGLRLEGVRLRTVSNELDIDYLVLQWDAPAALTRVLAFRSAESGNATYRRVPDVTASGGGPPELPWPLRVEQGSIGTLSITVLERTLVFQAETFATGTYEARRLVLTDVAGMFGGAALGASATIDLTDDIELEVAGDWSGPLAGVAASGTVELAGTWPDLTIRHELTAPFAATTTGTMTTGPFRVDVVNEWQDLAWPGVVGVASPNGRLALAGSLDDYRYDGSGTVDILGRPAGFTVEGTGQRLLLALARLELMPTAPGSGSLQGTGSLDLESRETTLEVTATRFDPVWIVGAWPGRLDGTARLRAGLRPEPNAALDAIALAGELRGYPVTLRGAAAVMGSERYRLDA